ncbi:ABC transporter permease [Natrialbaceae archaeon A-gly3]
METLFTQLLNGLTIGVVYVILAAGLSIIFGVMNVINFAHGELFAIGAYFAVAIIGLDMVGGGAGFVAALVLAPLIVGVIGVGIERFTVRPLYGRNPLYHILLTFGLVLILNDLIYLIWGPDSQRFPVPDAISGTVGVLGFSYSMYNLFMIVFAGALVLAIWALLEYTRYGLIIRAGAQDREMVRNLGINIDRYYSLVFGVGAALAAVAGIILGGYQSVNPEMGMSVIIPAFVIVVLGGLGSFRGAAVAGLLVGIIQTMLRAYVPILEGLVIFLLMIGLLLVRPQGLFGSEAPEDESQELLVGSGGGVLSQQTRVRLAVAGVAVLALLPLGVGTLYSTYAVSLMTEILIWGLFALSLDFVMGYTGLVSLGHALFYGMGAYAVMVLLSEELATSAPLLIATAVILCAVVAWVVGYLSIRVHGVYFAMITLGFAELFYNLVYKFDFTGGSDGLFIVPEPYYGVAGVGWTLDDLAFSVGPIAISGSHIFYYFVLAMLIGAFLLTRRMLQAPFGRVLKSVRENEQRSKFLGYDVTVYKRRAFVVSGGLAGLAGGLYALDELFVAPSLAQWLNSGEVIVMVILGGMGTLYGPIIGAGVFFGLEEGLNHYTDRWRLVLGTLFVLFVIFLPRGLISAPARIVEIIPDRYSPTLAQPGEPEERPTGGED